MLAWCAMWVCQVKTFFMNVFASLRFIMEKVDLVIVGAEGVAESGGVINKVSH